MYVFHISVVCSGCWYAWFPTPRMPMICYGSPSIDVTVNFLQAPFNVDGLPPSSASLYAWRVSGDALCELHLTLTKSQYKVAGGSLYLYT